MRVLVVEDDVRVAGALIKVLAKNGFHALHARDGCSALALLGPDIDLVLLDLGLPDMDGLEVCAQIRRVSDVPLIMVTARSSLDSRIKGLRFGADDYITKPYDVRELMARMEAVARRTRSGAVGQHDASVRTVGRLLVDLAARSVHIGSREDGTQVALTRKEFDVLVVMVRGPGVAVARERFLQEVWHTQWKGLGRSLEVHIAELRRKLSPEVRIEAVRGIGYRLVADSPHTVAVGHG